MSYLKSSENSVRFEPFDLNVGNLGEMRTGFDPFQIFIQSVLFALSDGLNAAICQIANIALKMQQLRLPLGEIAEPHALHSAFNRYFNTFDHFPFCQIVTDRCAR